MKYLKTVPYAGTKADDDVSLAIDVYRSAGVDVFCDRFAGSGKVGIAALMHTDALVEFWEIDPQLIELFNVMFFGTQYDRLFVDQLVTQYNNQLVASIEYWNALRAECKAASTELGKLAAFIAVQQNSASSNPRRNGKGDRNGGIDKTKTKVRGFVVPDLTRYAMRVRINESHSGSRFSYCDVPYFSPHGTQCYFGHNPKSVENLEQYILTTIDQANKSKLTMYCNCELPEVVDRMAQLGADGPYCLADLTKGSARAGNGGGIRHSYWLMKGLNVNS